MKLDIIYGTTNIKIVHNIFGARFGFMPLVGQLNCFLIFTIISSRGKCLSSDSINIGISRTFSPLYVLSLWESKRIAHRCPFSRKFEKLAGG